MTTKDTGGPAFPLPETLNPNGGISTYAQFGMTLRDYFAAKAMPAHIQMLSTATLPDWNAEIARLSYLVADAMLAERNKQ